MFDGGINHAEQWEGFGSSPIDQVQALTKALEAQEGVTDVANLVDVGALQPQSLEATLASLTFSEEHLTLWRDIPKGTAFSTLEEYSVQDGLGHEGGWTGQMESPLEGDPSAERKFAQVKFLRNMWKISDVAGIVRTITDSEVWAKRAAALRTLRGINTTLYSGDSAMIPEQIDGFAKTIENNGSSDHVIDLRGGSPSQQNFRDAAELVYANFGNPDNAGLYCSPGGINALDGVLESVGSSSSQRFLQGTVGADGGMSLGHSIKAINTSFGKLIPKRDLFIASEYEGRGVPKIKNSSGTLVEGATSVRAPATPSISVAASGSSDPNSEWAGSGVRPAGATYNYRVVAVNRFGRSKASTSDSAAAVAGEKNVVTITPGSSSYPATAYEIYSEQVAGSGDYKFMDRVADSGSATTTYDDLNDNIPGTTRMFLLDLSMAGERRTMQLARLAPMHSVEFSRIGHYRWGTVNLYAAAKYYSPLRFVMLKNVAIGVDSKSSTLEL